MRVFIELTNGRTAVMNTVGDADIDDIVQKWKDVNAGQYVSHRVPEDVEPTPDQPVFVPQSVTMRQARLALLAAGLLDSVTTAIAGAGQAAQIEWEYAQTVDRNAGLVPAMASALGMTDAQIDQLFIDGSKL